MNILDLLKDCSRIGISGHENPDGDCVGACCGMALFLREMRPEAKVDIYLVINFVFFEQTSNMSFIFTEFYNFLVTASPV